MGMGVDSIPPSIRNSAILTGNNLGQLGNVEVLPTEEEIDVIRNDREIQAILNETINDPALREVKLHAKAKNLLDTGNVYTAWKVLLTGI